LLHCAFRDYGDFNIKHTRLACLHISVSLSKRLLVKLASIRTDAKDDEVDTLHQLCSTDRANANGPGISEVLRRSNLKMCTYVVVWRASGFYLLKSLHCNYKVAYNNVKETPMDVYVRLTTLAVAVDVDVVLHDGFLLQCLAELLHGLFLRLLDTV
jgi:hypothetical protein